MICVLVDGQDSPATLNISDPPRWNRRGTPRAFRHATCQAEVMNSVLAKLMQDHQKLDALLRRLASGRAAHERPSRFHACVPLGSGDPCAATLDFHLSLRSEAA